MTTNFPDAIDGYTDPVGPQTLATNHHKQRHIDLQDAMVAVQTAVGVSGSDDPNSIQYRVTQASAAAGGAASALTAHEAAADPHPSYTTQAEVDVRVATLAPAETAPTLGAVISGATPKAAPADADSVGLSDSAAGGLLKKLTWGNVKLSIATYLDGFYARLAGVAGGQTINGGTGAGEALTFNSTSHATKGPVVIAGLGYFSQVLQRLGIGVASPTARVHIQAGTAAAGTAPLKIDSGSLLTTPEAGAIEVAAGGLLTFSPTAGSRVSVAVRDGAGDNLFANGLAELGTNYNLSTYSTYDNTSRHGPAFSRFGGGAGDTSSEFIPISHLSGIRLSATVVVGDDDGGNVGTPAGTYAGLSFFDEARLPIGPRHISKNPGASDTTLAVDLVPGATTITLTDATGWDNASGYMRHFAWWPYTSGSKLWPPYTYTRNNDVDNAGTSSVNGAWAQGSVLGNVIALSSAWTGPTLPAGTPVRATRTNSDSFYSVNGTIFPAGRSVFDGVFVRASGEDWDAASAGSFTAKIIPSASIARYAKLYWGPGGSGTKYRLTNISITGYAYPNRESAQAIGAAYKALRQGSLPADGLAVQGRLGVGTSSPAAALHIIATAGLLRAAYDPSNYLTAEVSSTGVATITTVGTAPALAIAGDVRLDKTITPAGTTGAQTIPKQMGSVNVAAGQSSVVVTNSRVTASSVIIATVATADATLKSVVAVAASGSFTLTGNAAASAETRVNFLVLN